MYSSLSTHIRLIRSGCAAIAATILVAAPFSAAQSFPDEARPEGTISHQLCFPGRPEPVCKSFILTDFSMLARVANSRSAESITFPHGKRLSGDDFGFPGAVQAEVGLMFNISERSAVGVTLAGVLEEYRDRVGAKLRYRFWEGDRVSIDAGAGAFTPVNEDDFVAALNRRQWVVGSLGLSQRDTWQFIFQIETWIQDFPEGRRTTAFYSGIQYREWPGPLPALVGLASAILVGAKSL